MSKMNHGPGPIPSGNRSDYGTAHEEPDQDEPGETAGSRTGSGA